MRLCAMVVLVAVASLGGCGGSGTSGFVVDAADRGLPEVADAQADPDVAEHTGKDLTPDAATDVPDLTDGEQASPPDAVGPGAPGYPCGKAADCLSGLCIWTPDGRQCTMTCEEECPFGWECLVYKPSLPDSVFVCAPAFMNLCRPCNAGADCLVNGVETGDACIPFGDAGSFCGGACADKTCPPGYSCLEKTSVEEGTSLQCVPESGECSCTEWFAEAAAKTACFVSNDWGTCTGERTCTAQGLSECSAAAPAAEVCNGLDDDCDGQEDEGLGLEACGLGVCAHSVEKCADGVPQTCDPLQGAEPETCDGLDDDCDGLTDEELGSATCGLGSCLHAQENCQAGKFVPCDPMAGAQVESCNDSDDDCDGDVDEPDAAGCMVYYLDLDADGYGKEGQSKCLCTPDELYSAPQAGDCLPLDEKVHPAAAEACNGLDDDCDGQNDEGLGLAACGLGTCAHSIEVCVGGQEQTCDPMEGAAAEACDGLDNDCDGQEDEDLGLEACGLGVCAHSVEICVGGQEQTCDPMEGASPELMDGLDNDCDGKIDENFCFTVSFDLTPDGQPIGPGQSIKNTFLPLGLAMQHDGYAMANGEPPSPPNMCGPNMDTQTYLFVDPNDPAEPMLADSVSLKAVSVGDMELTVSALGPLGQVLEQHALNNPGTGAGWFNVDPVAFQTAGIAAVRLEITKPFPGDGYGVDDFSYCPDPDSAKDADGDGYTPAGGDCDDGDPGVHPNQPDQCDNGVDDDCDGLVDDPCGFDSELDDPGILDEFVVTNLTGCSPPEATEGGIEVYCPDNHDLLLLLDRYEADGTKSIHVEADIYTWGWNDGAPRIGVDFVPPAAQFGYWGPNPGYAFLMSDAYDALQGGQCAFGDTCPSITKSNAAILALANVGTEPGHTYRLVVDLTPAGLDFTVARDGQPIAAMQSADTEFRKGKIGLHCSEGYCLFDKLKVVLSAP